MAGEPRRYTRGRALRAPAEPPVVVGTVGEWAGWLWSRRDANGFQNRRDVRHAARPARAAPDTRTPPVTWLSALFTLGYVGQAALLIALGPPAAPVVKGLAIGNALLCTLLLWGWHLVVSARGERRGRRRRLVPVGVLLLVPAFFLPTLADWYQEARVAMRTADTELFDVTDEPLESARGNVIGMRVGFTLVPPQTGYYSVEPLLRPPPAVHEALMAAARAAGVDEQLLELRVVRRVIDPLPRAINVIRLSEDVLDRATGGLYLEEGVAYGVTFDLLPGYLLDPRDPLPLRSATDLFAYCVALSAEQARRAGFDDDPALERPQPYRIAISQTSFGWNDATEPGADTAGAYAPAQWYRGIRAEGAATCDSAG